ncbi:hypothetical protein AM433_004509 [Pseudomonas aeruginosa]|nr:hypothetical protein AM433_004509 [Pseudomonas aeruginosa]
MRRAEMLLLKSLAETLMADRDNRHDDLQATMRLAHLSSPEMILYMVNRVLELEESIERIAAVLQKLSADEPMPLEETPPEPAFEPALQSAPPRPRKPSGGQAATPAPGECWRSAHAPVAPPAPPPALRAPPLRAGQVRRGAEQPADQRTFLIGLAAVRSEMDAVPLGQGGVVFGLALHRQAGHLFRRGGNRPQQSWQPACRRSPVSAGVIGLSGDRCNSWEISSAGEGLYSADRSIPKVPVRMLTSEPNRPVQPALSPFPARETARLPVRPPVHGYLPSRRSRAR